MSDKPGRNDPCPCGSGKKYKRCCLATDAAARAPSRQQALFDAAGLDERNGDLSDPEPHAPILDVRAMRRVCYTRGFVKKLSDLRSGRGVRVTEWEAPHVPQEVLDSIAREAVDVLEGQWGDPKAGDPIQVDVLDLETETDIVSIEVFNRAISLIYGESEEMRRIHRVCGILEAAAPDDADRSVHPQGPSAPTLTIIRREAAPRTSAAVDMSDVLKQHRRQGGACALCGEALSRGKARSHVAGCAAVHDASTGAAQRLIHLRATAPGLPAYWLDVEVKADAKLDAIDSLLRRVWLECCGHLSMFTIGAVKYFSRGYDFEFTRGFGGFGRSQVVERSMSARCAEALPLSGEPFGYEYDFGSTTRLQLKVIGERTGRLGRQTARLLVQNAPPVWPCAVCRQPATLGCAYCLQDEGNAFVCAKHRQQHACGEEEGLLPVVNSPRMGVCGYTGKT
jgi:hypothetical protein